MKRERIAVIGGGAAGISAAFALVRVHDVTLFEADDRLGGHAWPFPIAEGIELDTAFLIFNSHSYPEFHKFLNQLGVSGAVADTDMSIGLHHEASGLRYGVNGGAGDWLGYARNAGNGRFRRLLAEIRRFRAASSPAELARLTTGLSLEAFLRERGFSEYFAEQFAYPLGASVWSLPLGAVKSLPAALYFAFFNNHKLLKREEGARWQTLRGSSGVYLRAFREKFALAGGRLRTRSPVRSVRRSAAGCELALAGGAEAFDRAVIATHADDALRLLAQPTEIETNTLGAWAYRKSESILHTDEALFPRSWNGWSSWNVATAAGSGAFGVTYYLNRIQRASLPRNYFLSWGDVSPRASQVLARFAVKHPSFTPATERARAALPGLRGERLAFAGSYFGNGFHEDAVRSGFAAAARWGAPC